MSNRTTYKDEAAKLVAVNWRLRKRLPHITTYAIYYGFLCVVCGQPINGECVNEECVEIRDYHVELMNES